MKNIMHKKDLIVKQLNSKPNINYEILLSPYQQTFYHDWILNSCSSKYNITFDQTLSNNLNPQKLTNALQKMISEVLIFNSHIKKTAKGYVWNKNSRIEELKIINKEHDYNYILNLIKTPFNLNTGPLYRFLLFYQLDGSYRFIITIHHILIDGMNFNNLLELIANYYNNENYQFEITLNDQIVLITNKNIEFLNQINIYRNENKIFWQQQLNKLDPVDLKFAKIFQNKSENINPINEINFNLTEKYYSQLKELTHKYFISTYNYSKIIFAIMLYRYTQQNQFGIAYSIAIKNSSPIISGANINTAIFPFFINNTTTIKDLINQSKNFINTIKDSTFNYTYYPIEQIIQNNKFLNILFAQTNLKQTKLQFKNVETIRINNDYNIDNADSLLTFEQEIKQQNLHFRIRYNKNNIDTVIIQNFIHQYIKLFKLILNNLLYNIDDTLIKDYPVLSSYEHQKISHKWNAKYNKYPDSKTIHQLFEEEVIKNPDNIAIINENEQFTYHELNQRSNQLANYLQSSYNIVIEDPIIVFLDRNPNIIITLLAILKLGASYVALDSNYPSERLYYIIKDTKTKLVITNKTYKTLFNKLNNSTNVIFIDNTTIQKKILSCNKMGNSIAHIKYNNLAYISYTSGTTGNPKGVMVEHHNVISLVKNINYIKINNTDCFLQLGAISFDASVFEIWGALLNGAKVYISKNIFNFLANKELLNQIINQNNVSIIFLTKSLFDTLYLQDKTLFKKIKYLLIGGETLNYNLIQDLINSKNKPANLINIYGPTENTTFSCAFKITKNNISNKLSIPIGKPLNNRYLYILDNNLNMMPIGAIGEIYLGGAGLSRGYLNSQELTNEKFINNCWQIYEENKKYITEKLYKTGDLARWLPNGNIEYIGRNDLQIKIRGYRIEINEIENKINQYCNIQKSIVTMYSNNNNKDQYLIAYYIANSKIDENQLTNYLLTHLPDYMVPHQFIAINKVPLTTNGKLDIKTLPVPKLLSKQSFIAPNNQLELEICQAYAEILNLPKTKVGINHDFFKIGGNSILAIQLVAKLQYNFKININDIFKLKTPKNIATHIEFFKNNLNNNLSKIELIYKNINQYKINKKNKISEKRKKYLDYINKIVFSNKSKNIKSILLTGSTGHLGCYMLLQLLKYTSYQIVLLIRAKSDQESYIRITEKFRYYFNESLDLYIDRIELVTGDIKKNNLGLDNKKYANLYKKIDSIIHVAALVKHYGNYNEFYQANVQGTIHLLEFSKLTKLKDFHYISTISIFMDGYIPNTKYYEFCEDDDNSILMNKIHIYSQTKYEGEVKVIEYRKYGIKSNIYRVANLAVNSQGYSNQYDIENNAFFVRMKTFFLMKMIPKEYLNLEISPVDYTALAIVKLFDKIDLSNQTYHVFNPNYFDMSNFIILPNINIKIVDLKKFINKIKDLNTKSQLEQNETNLTKQIKLFMLHQSWLSEINIEKVTHSEILQDKTNFILQKIDFSWPIINNNMLINIFKT